MRALILLLTLLACAAAAVNGQSCRFPSFQSILADQPGLTILTQVFRRLEDSNPTAVPGPADGVTLLAPTDTAFVTLLAGSGLTALAAQRTLAAKAQSILQYHLLDGGGFTAAELLDNAAVQSSLGRTLGRPLPLTFTAGTTRGSVTASGVTGNGTLSAATPVCTSSLYVIDTVLLPSRTLATVPSAAAAEVPATAPALAPALGPAADVAASPAGAAAAASAPISTPLADLAPSLAPSALLAPDAAPGLAPGLAPELAPGLAAGPGLGPAPVAAPGLAPAPVPANSASVPGTSPAFAFGVAPAAAPPTDQSAGSTSASAAAVLACSGLAAAALLAAL